jgi:hypothetical protein
MSIALVKRCSRYVSSLFQYLVHHDRMAALEVFLDECRHQKVASQIQLFFHVESVPWCFRSELHRLSRLSRSISANTPLRPDVHTCWSEDMCLDACGKVVETCLVDDLTRK